MNTSLTLMGSIVIGGIFLLGVLTFHSRVVEHSFDKTFELHTQETTLSLMEIIEHDFQKIGSGVATPALAISDTNEITFFGDVNEDGLVDTVRYSLSAPSAASFTPNPNDRILYRYENGVATLEAAIGVIDFNITLLDYIGNTTTQLMDVWQIKATLKVESVYPNDGKYSKAVWEKRFTPINLYRHSINNF